MELPRDMSREDMEKALEKAKRDLQETLDKMTPEEREQAAIRAKKLIEEDEAEQQRLLAIAHSITRTPAPQGRPKFCPNCGAPVTGGKFCANCGEKLV